MFGRKPSSETIPGGDEFDDPEIIKKKIEAARILRERRRSDDEDADNPNWERPETPPFTDVPFSKRS